MERIRGGLLGSGLDRSLRTGYQWLVDNYDDGDHIYLFGFSRGPYTARTVAGMIARCGLLEPETTMSAEDVFDRYRRRGEVTPLYRIECDIRDGRAMSAEDNVCTTNPGESISTSSASATRLGP